MSETPLSFDEVSRDVRDIIAEALKRPVDAVVLDSRLDDRGLALDSLSLIKINVALEERFDVTMPEFDGPEAAKVQSVRDVVELVLTRLGRGEA